MTKIWMHGHSLFEIIIVLVILSFMLLSGIFAWTVFEKQQMNVFVNRFYHTLHLARMQAIASSQPIEVCATEDFKHCSTQWSEHFMIFNPTQSTCLYQGTIPQKMKITSNVPICFKGNGEAKENGTLTLHFGNQFHQIVMITTGRIRLV